MNVAIILAISNYANPGNNLPASKKDGDVVHGILQATKKYDKILSLNNSDTSSKIKELLSNFFVECKNQRIDELFFYYSGHGEFSSDEFYYLLSDFDPKKKNQTTLQNNEIDDLIRTLNPQMVIKFIDACQSGTSYIKETDVLTKYFNETKKGFNKCYFLNSSLTTQSSYQDDNLSYFTYSFVQALKEHPGSEIRYKDIIDFILDDFNGNKHQTPFFVIQAELTEKFCSLSSEFKEHLFSSETKTIKIDSDSKNSSSLLELVKANAKDYVDKEGALKALEFSRKKIQGLSLDTDISELYEISIEFTDDNNKLVGVRAIGKWLKDNSHDFLASPQYKEYYDDDSGEMFSNLIGYHLQIEEAPFKGVEIEIKSKFPNVKSYRCSVAVLVSKKQLTLFYCILPYIDSGWDSINLDSDKIKWIYTNTNIAHVDSLTSGVKSIEQYVNDRIKSDISIQFGLKSAEGEKSDDDLPF
ncbi:MAG TPA: caspase family protein [Cyclobacteriaceae bacterium]|nr:caspase family protein [Cyclobacteriaceae bacterium]